MRALRLDDCSGRTAAVVEQLVERHASRHGVFSRHAERSCGKAELLDEIAPLVRGREP